MKKILLISAMLLTSLVAEIKIGTPFPQLYLRDQFDETIEIDKRTRYVVIAFEKNVAVAVASYFRNRPKGFLKRNRIVYISDISAMPSFITSFFALPKMKKYPFSVLLIRDDRGKIFDKKESKATLYTLKNGIVVAKTFVTPENLAKALRR